MRSRENPIGPVVLAYFLDDEKLKNRFECGTCIAKCPTDICRPDRAYFNALLKKPGD